MTIKDIKKGEFFTIKPIAYPKDSQVWIKGEYDRAEKAWLCTRFSDMNDWKYVKASKQVYTEFTF